MPLEWPQPLFPPTVWQTLTWLKSELRLHAMLLLHAWVYDAKADVLAQIAQPSCPSETRVWLSNAKTSKLKLECEIQQAPITWLTHQLALF